MIICSETAEAYHVLVQGCDIIEILTHLVFRHGVIKIELITVDDILRHIGVEISRDPTPILSSIWRMSSSVCGK